MLPTRTKHMEEEGGGEPQETTFTGTPNVAPADAPAGAFDQPTVMMGPKSSLPKVMGILMMIYGGLFGLFSILALLSTGTQIDDLEMMGITVNAPFMWVDALVNTGYLLVVAFAGYQVFNYQKSGVKLGLYAIGVDLLFAVIGAVVFADMMAEIAGDGAAGAILGGIGAFASVFCAAICGLFVALPVLASGDSMED